MIIDIVTLIRIFFTTIGTVLVFFGGAHLLFHKMGLPGFEGKWAVSLGSILILVSVALYVTSFVIL